MAQEVNDMDGLTKTVPTTKQVPVKVLNFKWYGALKEGSVLCKLPCSTCKEVIGSKRWGIAWTEGNISMRLCEKCGQKARAALGKEGKDGT